jgi:choice-of-anchor C domain-containing protein
MSPHRLLMLFGVLCLLPLLSHAGDQLPSGAARRIKEFENDAEAIQKKADAEINVLRKKLIEELQALEKDYTKSGNLDAAIAIRDRIAQLKLAGLKNLIVNGSFEDGPDPGDQFVTLDKGSTAIKGWEVTQGDIDYINASYWQAAEGRRSLDMNGAQPGAIAQTFKTKKGQKYRVTFSLAGNPDGGPAEKKIQVSAAGKKAEFTFDGTGKARDAMGWVTKTWDFTADADMTTLEFASLIDGNAGPALDNVVVVALDE